MLTSPSVPSVLNQEIAPQGLGALGLDHLVVRLGVVVHADVQVAGGAQAFVDELLQIQAGSEGGQVGLVDELLVLLHPGHVGVGEDGEAVRPPGQHPIQGVGEAGGVLVGQAHDQVHVDAGKAQFPRPAVNLGDQRLGLHAVHGLLHPVVQILHAQGQAVEARFAQGHQVFPGELARVGFTTHFRVRRDVEAGADHGHQLADVVGLEIGGRAAAPVELLHLATRVGEFGDPGHFLLQVAQVLGRLGVFARGHHVAAAVVAEGVAERDVDVEGQAAGRGLGGFEFPAPVGFLEFGMEVGGGRV